MCPFVRESVLSWVKLKFNIVVYEVRERHPTETARAKIHFTAST
jgi:hypothetical protein